MRTLKLMSDAVAITAVLALAGCARLLPRRPGPAQPKPSAKASEVRPPAAPSAAALTRPVTGGRAGVDFFPIVPFVWRHVPLPENPPGTDFLDPE